MAARTVPLIDWYRRQPAAVKVLAVAGGGAAAVVAGVFAAPVIGAAASAAGLGAAAGTLSGAAASSAGLAALGGGALAAGGMGVAGGTAVVASVTGAAGAAATAYASQRIAKRGGVNRRSGSGGGAAGSRTRGYSLRAGPVLTSAANDANVFASRAKNGEKPVARVAVKCAEAFLGPLFRAGFTLAKECLENISNPELRQMVETIFFAATAGAVMGAAIGGAVGGCKAGPVGAMVGAGLGTLAGCVALVVKVHQNEGSGGPELVVAVQ